MPHSTPRGVSRLVAPAAAAAVTVVLAACVGDPTSAPTAATPAATALAPRGPAFNVVAATQRVLKVCTGDGPAGTYTYQIVNIVKGAGSTSTAATPNGTTFNVPSGGCVDAVQLTFPVGDATSIDQPTQVTVAQIARPAGVAVSYIQRSELVAVDQVCLAPANFPCGSDTKVAGPQMTVAINKFHGSVGAWFHAWGAIGDFVWNDANGNGIQDGGETGIAGVTVTLNGPGGTQTTTTGAAGEYGFSGLEAGTYTVSVPTPAGFTASPIGAPGSTPANDSNDGAGTVVTLAAGESNQTIDFGFFHPTTGGKACTYTQGYWKNHEESWPAPYAPTAQWMTPQKKVAGLTWDGLFGTAPKGGNSYVQLAHQWMAAKLNVAQGAPTSPSVLATLNAAEAWLLANTPVNGPLPSIKNAQADAWMSALDTFNNGKAGTPHCD